jgi:hypothetical protein
MPFFHYDCPFRSVGIHVKTYIYGFFLDMSKKNLVYSEIIANFANESINCQKTLKHIYL